MTAASRADLIAERRSLWERIEEIDRLLEREHGGPPGSALEDYAVPGAVVPRRLPKEGPGAEGGLWYVSARAIEEFAELVRKPCQSEEEYHHRRRELAAEIRGAIYKATQDNGLELWRMRRPYRFRLMVSRAERPEGPKAQLVSVLPASPHIPQQNRDRRG